MFKISSKIFAFFLCFCLVFEQPVFAQTAQALDVSGYFNRIHRAIIPQDSFRPLHLRSISYDSQNSGFSLLLDKGDTQLDSQASGELSMAAQELLKYFYVGLSLPNDKFWVNLRPDSPDNIIDDDLAMTDIGRIFLEADIQLKKDTANFTSPQTKEGREYWDRLYKKAEELFGAENITIPTLTRPWIVPDEVIIRESPEGAYIYKATLKVMLEEDYLESSQPSAVSSQQSKLSYQPLTSNYNFSDPRLKELNEYSTQLIKETIIPKLTQAVNTSKRYAPLRQVYYSLILAQWFKQSHQVTRPQNHQLPENPYIKLIDSGKLDWASGSNLSLTTSHFSLLAQQPYDKQTYFKQYQKSFAEGEYDFSGPVYAAGGKSIRRYMSGGIEVSSSPALEIIPSKHLPIKNDDLIRFNFAGSGVKVSDIDRLGREKLLKISGEIRKIGERILEQLFLEYPDVKDEFVWLKDAESADEHIKLVIGGIRRKHNVDMFPRIAKLNEELRDKNKEFKMILKAVNESPEAIRHMAAERSKRNTELREILSALGARASTINIYVDNRIGGGVMGTARLVAESLVNVSGNIKVNIFVFRDVMEPDGINFTHGSKDNVAIRFILIAHPSLLSKAGLYYDMVKEAKVHISVEAEVGFLGLEDTLFRIKSLPPEQGYDLPLESFYKQMINDLTSLYGVVPLSGGLKKRHENKNTAWTVERIIGGRRQWLDAVLQRETALDLLKELSDEEGWVLEKAIWTSGYYQDRANFLNETDILCQAFKSKDTLGRIPFISGGKQLIMHLVPGKWSGNHGEWGQADRDAISSDLLRRGIAVVDATGKTIYAKPVSRLPITVVLHETINNQELKTLLSELSGTLQRDRENKFWIEFPVFVTGNASWLEAVSCGLPFLHDNFQISHSLYKGILVSTLMRMLALEDEDNPSPRSWEELKIEAEGLASEFIMGENNDPAKYRSLEEWTRQANEYAEAMLKFNLIDDVIWKIVQPSRAPAKEAPITEKTSYEERKKIIEGWESVRQKVEIVYRERETEYSAQGKIIYITYSNDKYGKEIMTIDLSSGYPINVNNIIEARELRDDGASKSLERFLKEAAEPSLASPAEKNNDLGGIDMRVLPVTVPPASDLRLPVSMLSPITPGVNFNEECRQIESMLNNDFIPATVRIRDIAYAASRATPSNNERIEAVINHIARILRKQEQAFIPTEPALKQILIEIESDKPANEIQLALTNITVLPKDMTR